MTPEQSLKFIIGVDVDDWALKDALGGVQDGVKVTHFTLEYKGTSEVCPQCGQPMRFHDYRERTWRHANLDDTVCFLHAKVPRCQCPKCGTISQVRVPWADPEVTYTKRFMEVAIEHLAQMSLRATSRMLIVSWSILDGIVERIVREYLDRMDLSGLRQVRID